MSELDASAIGALACGVGYAVWYTAPAGWTVTRAATALLSVPVIAVIGGVLRLGASLTRRFVLASHAIQGEPPARP